MPRSPSPGGGITLDEELQSEFKLPKESKVNRQHSMQHQRIDNQAPLAHHVHIAFLILHLCYEVSK